jgi:hypothetical protein
MSSIADGIASGSVRLDGGAKEGKIELQARIDHGCGIADDFDRRMIAFRGEDSLSGVRRRGAQAFASALGAEGSFRGLGFLRTLMAAASNVFLMWEA